MTPQPQRVVKAWASVSKTTRRIAQVDGKMKIFCTKSGAYPAYLKLLNQRVVRVEIKVMK